MLEKALQYWLDAWNQLKNGNFFDESVNNKFEMMLKSLWKTEKKGEIKAQILAHLGSIYEKIKDLETPAPVLFILISLGDDEILSKIQGLMVSDFIHEKGSENSVFNLGNLINTLSDKGKTVGGIVNIIARSIQPSFHKDYVQALCHIVSVQHPQFMGAFVRHFLEFEDTSWLKDYIRSNGRKALLEAMRLADDPVKLNRILGGANVGKN